jgi:hypothetical protein
VRRRVTYPADSETVRYAASDEPKATFDAVAETIAETKAILVRSALVNAMVTWAQTGIRWQE